MELMVIGGSALETSISVGDFERTPIMKQVDSKKIIAANTKYGLRLGEKQRYPFLGVRVANICTHKGCRI